MSSGIIDCILMQALLYQVCTQFFSLTTNQKNYFGSSLHYISTKSTKKLLKLHKKSTLEFFIGVSQIFFFSLQTPLQEISSIFIKACAHLPPLKMSGYYEKTEYTVCFWIGTFQNNSQNDQERTEYSCCCCHRSGFVVLEHSFILVIKVNKSD